MQLFTLYNFASNAAVIRGGRQGRLRRTGLISDGFQVARDFCGEMHIYSQKYGETNRKKWAHANE